MIVHCPTCGSRIPAGDVELDNLTAKCRQCDAVFRFDLGETRRAGTLDPDLEGRTVGRPACIRIEEHGQATQIVYRWFNWVYVFLIFVTIFWDSIVASLVYGFVSGGLHGRGPTGAIPWMFALIPIPHVLIGLFLPYLTLAGFLNRTILEFSDLGLRVWHTPLPWPGNRQFRADEIRAVRMRERVRYGKGGRTVTYHVQVRTINGLMVTVISGLHDEDAAEFITQEIRQRLKLPVDA